jgi:hypothetical protein
MSVYSTSINVEIEKENFYYEGEIEVIGEYSEPCRGERGSYGEPLEPDDPGGFDILSITTPDGTELQESDLTQGELDRIHEGLFASRDEEIFA